MLIRICLICSFFLFGAIPSVCQLTLQDYKKISDKLVKFEFSTKIADSVRCEGYIVIGKKVGEGYGGDYEPDKRIIISGRPLVLIFYRLWSMQLGHEFSFHAIIDSNLNAEFPIGEFDNIPQCIKSGENCKLQPKHSALLAAISDSISYHSNLSADLFWSKASGNFVWVIIGHDPKVNDFSLPEPKEGWRPIMKTKYNTRYVNATTGDLISFDQFIQ